MSRLKLPYIYWHFGTIIPPKALYLFSIQVDLKE